MMPEHVHAEQLIRAAHVRRAHGVHGEIRAEPLGNDVSRFSSGLRLCVETDGRVLTVTTVRATGEGDVLLRFSEIATRDDAEALHGAYLCVTEDQLRPLTDGEWFVHQLINLMVVTPDGVQLGPVVDVEEYVGNDVIVVETQAGTRRFPMVNAFVRHIDVAAGVMVVTPWPESEDN